MKRIYLIDDHPMLREGLASLINQHPDCEVCGESESAAQALEAILHMAPDLVVTDISLPDKSGLELIKDLHVHSPGLPILVYSMHDEMLYAERVIRAGGKGYLMKGTPVDQLSEAIDCVLSGGVSLSCRVSNHILQNLSGSRTSGKGGLKSLSDRELEILELIGSGKTTAQIAEQLHISPKTADAHRANIRSKLALPDGPALMREAVLWVELGLGSGRK
jgi:DNA-binding NarL/FixJ family response regulator